MKMNIKKITRTLFLFLLLAPAPLFADDLDDILADPESININRTWNIDCSDAVQVAILTLLESLDAINLLENDFYLRTNFLNTRSLLDYPEFYSDWYNPRERSFGMYLFYNQTSRMRFTRSSDSINSYLSVGPGGFTNSLQAVIRKLMRMAPEEFPFEATVAEDLLALIANFTVQERRFGLMFDWSRPYNKWFLQVKFPWYYLERNYFVGPSEEAEIRDIITGLGITSTPSEEKKFQDDHLISDKFGIGDTRVELDYMIYDNCGWQVRAGGMATLPTALKFVSGLRGSSFTKLKDRPVFDLCLLNPKEVVTPAGMQALQEEGLPFIFAVLDDLSAILLDQNMGNNGHLGLGLVLYTRGCLGSFIPRPWADKIKIQSRISGEYLLPNTDTKCFIPFNNAQEFQGRDFTDDDEAEENFEFITQVITDRFFPFVFRARVSPGFIFHWSTKYMYEGKKWGFYVGGDTYIRTPERITNIKAPCNIVNTLMIHKAEKSFVYQSKLMGGITYSVHRPYREWTLSLNGDKTFISSGIGKDYMITFNMDVRF